MGHQPFETWMLSEETLLPDQEQRLHDHIEICESCRQMSNAWQEVQGIFSETPLAKPSAGFTERWQVRFNEMSMAEITRSQRRASWLFFGVMTGAALLILGFLVIQFFSSVQAPVQVFIYGVTMLAGLMTLANAVQVAFIPLLEVLIVSIPPLWWFILAFAACLLTLLMTFSIRQFLFPRRVSL
jgi:predicted anti-sigma-YlaC factor YlaD